MDLALIALAVGLLWLTAAIAYRVGRDTAHRDDSRQIADHRAAARHLKRERDRLAAELADLRAYLKDNR